MRNSQSALGSSGMWNWTCSVFSALTAASSLASGSLHSPPGMCTCYHVISKLFIVPFCVCIAFQICTLLTFHLSSVVPYVIYRMLTFHDCCRTFILSQILVYCSTCNIYIFESITSVLFQSLVYLYLFYIV